MLAPWIPPIHVNQEVARVMWKQRVGVVRCQRINVITPIGSYYLPRMSCEKRNQKWNEAS